MVYDKNNKDCPYKLEIMSLITNCNPNNINLLNHNLKTYACKKDNCNVYKQSVTLVDIKPANYEEIEREQNKAESERKKQEIESAENEIKKAESEGKEMQSEKQETSNTKIEQCLNGIQEDNFDDRDFVVEQDIDMEDIFKGMYIAFFILTYCVLLLGKGVSKIIH